MNVFDYLKYYGNYTFSEREFNEIDNVIFSILSYVNFNFIVSKNRRRKITLNEASYIYDLMHDSKDNKNNILAIRQAIKLLKKIKDVPRFKDVLVYNYRYIGNDVSQFSAITFEISNKLCYVAFEGTDHLVSGWKEDCKMSYKFPVDAHRYAIKYLNKFMFFNKKIIVGGHSKGGNLALVSSMYTNCFVRGKIIKIYSNDGQGLREEQIKSDNYNKIEDKYIHIIPNNSTVGLLLKHKDNYRVIKSNAVGLLAHDAITWQVDGSSFMDAQLSNFSKVLEIGMESWLDKYSDEEREKFVDCVFSVLSENNIQSLVQFKTQIGLIFKILKSNKNVDLTVKNMITDLFKVLSDTNKEYKWFNKNE